MDNIKSLLPVSENKKQRQIAMALQDKWMPTGLLDGLSTEYERANMAVLLENQAKELVLESNRTGTDANSEEWAGVALPLVRRIFTEIASKDFVSVQTMNLPAGLVFFLDIKYASGQAGFNTSSGRTSQADSIFGITDPDKGTAPSEGLYGAGRFGYSINNVTSSILTSQATPDSTHYYSASANWTTDINFDSEFSASYKGSSLLAISVSTGSLSNADVKGIRAFTLTGTAINDVYNQFTRLSGANIIFVVSGSATGVENLRVVYHKSPTNITRGDFEEGATQASSVSGEDLEIPKLNIEMRSEPIVAKTRKLKAVWTPEFSQDLNAFHNIDAEGELTGILSEYVSQEIDLEILDMLIQSAPTVERWSARIGYVYDSGASNFADAATNGQAYVQGTWYQTLGTKVQKVSNKIHQLTMRGGANFLVCGPTVATILESIPGYAADTNGDKAQFAMGVQKIGTLNSRFQVYKVPYILENVILLGYRGSQFLETGAVYAPYVPLVVSPLVYDPENFTPRKGVFTRYAKKMIRPEFYGKIYVHGLNYV